MKEPRSVSMPSGPLIFDRQGALRRLGGDETLMREMAKFFLEDAPGLLEEIRTNCASSNAEEAARAAHSLKGLASNFGAAKTESTARQVEEASRAQQFESVQKLLPTLEHDLQQLMDTLARELQL